MNQLVVLDIKGDGLRGSIHQLTGMAVVLVRAIIEGDRIAALCFWIH
jgi:hypothetical protein